MITFFLQIPDLDDNILELLYIFFGSIIKWNTDILFKYSSTNIWILQISFILNMINDDE